MEGQIVKLDGPLCGGLYRKDYGYIVSWYGTDPDPNMSCFTWSRKDNEWVVLGDQYNKKFKNWQGTMHHGKFHANYLKKEIRTYMICSKFSGSIRFNGIPREGNLTVPIQSNKDQCRDQMIKKNKKRHGIYFSISSYFL